MMRKFFSVLVIAVALFSCNTKGGEPTLTDANGLEYFGDKIDMDGAIAAKAFFDTFTDGDSLEMKVTGEIKEVCKKKGCWMSMNVGNEDDALFVKFKDYGFFVPLNADGRTATISGWAYKDVQTVEALKHYAFDAGKSDEEIAAITEPEISYTFMASRVIIE